MYSRAIFGSVVLFFSIYAYAGFIEGIVQTEPSIAKAINESACAENTVIAVRDHLHGSARSPIDLFSIVELNQSQYFLATSKGDFTVNVTRMPSTGTVDLCEVGLIEKVMTGR
jgi:hypothetical protein